MRFYCAILSRNLKRATKSRVWHSSSRELFAVAQLGFWIALCSIPRDFAIKSRTRATKSQVWHRSNTTTSIGRTLQLSIRGRGVIRIVIAFSMSLIVSPFTLVVIILDFISSTVMLSAVWTLLSAATLMSGTGYQLMSWTVTVSQYLSEDWHV